MKKNKIKEFFRFTIGKVVLTLIIGLIFFTGGIICSPGYFIGGTPFYPCGYIPATILWLPYYLPITIPIHLALIYAVSCLIVYIWRMIRKNAKK